KNRGKVLIPRTAPLERPTDRAAPANVLHRQPRNKAGKDQRCALTGSIVVVVDAPGGERSRRELVAKSRRPRGSREDFSPLVDNRSLDLQNISVVETKSLPHHDI